MPPSSYSTRTLTMSLPQALKPAARPQIVSIGPTLYVRGESVGPNTYTFNCPIPGCMERIRACQGQHVGDCGHEFDIWPLAGGGADVTFDRWQIAAPKG